MIPRPPRSTRTATRLPYTTRFRSDRLPVAGDGDGRGQVLIAVEVAHKAADIALKGSETGSLRHHLAHFGHADVDGDVLVQQFGRDAEFDIVGHKVAGVDRDDQNSACPRSAKDTSGFAHRRDRKSSRLKLQSLMRTSYAVFCWKKKTTANTLTP